jgi:DNA-binding XRE family transcriptional regulator
MAKTTRNFAEVLRAKLNADPELAKAVDQERLHADIAEQIIRLRNEAGMTQKELAELAGTKQSVISRIEDADYYGHSLKTLNRIAYAFDKRIVVVFVAEHCVRQLIPHATAWAATNTVTKMQSMSHGSAAWPTYFLTLTPMAFQGENQPSISGMTPTITFQPTTTLGASSPRTDLVPVK